jgi:hypothetical protein
LDRRSGSRVCFFSSATTDPTASPSSSRVIICRSSRTSTWTPLLVCRQRRSRGHGKRGV